MKTTNNLREALQLMDEEGKFLHHTTWGRGEYMYMDSETKIYDQNHERVELHVLYRESDIDHGSWILTDSPLPAGGQ